jgi:hypothetical protein
MAHAAVGLPLGAHDSNSADGQAPWIHSIIIRFVAHGGVPCVALIFFAVMAGQ